MRQKENKIECLESFFKKMNAASEILEILSRMLEYNWTPKGIDQDYKPKPREAVKILEKLMSELQASQDGQKFAFGSEEAFDVYWVKQISVSKEFKFLNKGTERVGPYTKSMLIYEQFLPFNNEKHDDDGCVAVEDLPLFYKSKIF